MKIQLNLLQNAHDSLERAIELVAWRDEQPEPRRLKQAIQSIAHGIELLLKERLTRVHPALIWENVDKYPSLNARTVSAELAMTRLNSIGNVSFASSDLELIRSLRATRNAIEHYSWTTTKQEAEAIIGRALEFALYFSRSELNHDFFGYGSHRDDTLPSLVASNPEFAASLTRRAERENETPEELEPLICRQCKARAVDPVTYGCRLCGHWGASAHADDALPF